MSKSPIIGITTYSRSEAGEFYLPAAYVDAVRMSGGTPILLPPSQPDPDRILEVLDGLVFSGGGDIDPLLYGGSMHPMIYLVDEERDQFELALAKAALTQPLPVLGICRGMQLLNVASGGSLMAHVPDDYGDRILHRLDNPRRPTQHRVQVAPDSRLSQVLGSASINVVSWHHQALKAVAPGWQVVGQAEDGLVEAVEHQQHPWMLGVQWHPEMSPDDPVHRRLFQSLVEAAAQALHPQTQQ